MAKNIKTRKGNDGFHYPYTSPDLVIDGNGKSVTTKFSEINTQFNEIAEQVENIGQPTQEQINAVIDKAIQDGKIPSDASELNIIDTNNNFISTNVEGALSELFQNVSNGKQLIATAITDKGVTTSSDDTFQVMADNIRRIVTETISNYSITNNLTNCTSNNNSITITEGQSYTATIASNTGYELSSVTVIMNGEDITSSCYSNGIINITNVTGDIVITAIAEINTDLIVGSVDSDNNISLTGLAPGTYTLKYEDNNGVLEGYDSITTMEVN